MSSSSSSSSDGGSSSSKAEAVTSKAQQEDEQPDAKKRRKERSDSSASGSGGAGSDDSSSSSEEAKEAKKKKEKKKKDKAKKKDKKRKKKEKKSKKEKKKDKKSKGKKDKKKGKKSGKKGKTKVDAVSSQFGKYGIVKAEDFYNKKPEFLAWAMEVKKANTDSMCQMDMKNLFKEYIEDYNTATMPSKKYYNLQAWDSMQAKKRQQKKRGDEMSEALKSALASFDDEKARREEIKHIQAKKQEEMITSEIRKMKANKAKVEDMQTQARVQTQVEMLRKAGLTEEANKLAQRLQSG